MGDLITSVVIPCYRARNTLPALLDSLAGQTLDRARFEIIVVDDDSDDGTRGYVSNLDGVRLLGVNHGGPGAARNAGMAAAQGTLVHFLDADLVASRELLQIHAEFHQAHPDIAATSGSVLPGKNYPLLSWALTDHFCSWFNVHPATRYPQPPEYLPSLNLCVKRECLTVPKLIRWLDGLKITGEDVLFCRDLRQAGHRLAFLPEAKVYHRDRDTLPAYWRHMFRWGEHAPFVRGECKDLKYGFLFPNSRALLCFTMPLIIAGYTGLIWLAWLKVRPGAVTLALPQILLGRIAYAYGVWVGTARKLGIS